MNIQPDLAALTLYNFPRSSASFRVRIAMNLKGIAASHTVDLDIREGRQLDQAYCLAMPVGLVPAVAWEGGHLSQSLAIIEWLDAVTPQGPRLIPSDPLEAARVRELALIIACDIHPLNNLRVLKHLTGTLAISEAEKLGWYEHWVRQGFAGVEKILTARRGTNRFALTEEPSLADVCIVPQVFNARRFNICLEEYPQILEVCGNCLDIEAFKVAAPRD